MFELILFAIYDWLVVLFLLALVLRIGLNYFLSSEREDRLNLKQRVFSLAELYKSDSSLITFSLIVAFAFIMGEVRGDLLTLSRGGSIPPELPKNPEYWYGAWIAFDVLILTLMYSLHRKLKMYLSNFSRRYVLTLCVLMVVEFVGYIDTALLGKTESVGDFYTYTIVSINISVFVMMLFDTLKLKTAASYNVLKGRK